MGDVLHECVGNVEDFLAKSLSEAGQLGLDLTPYEIDHFCYRCASLSEYQQIKARMVAGREELLQESMIGGRPISIFLLANPIRYLDWSIPCLELASPKAGRLHKAGLEHIEVVVGTDPAEMHNSKELLELFVGRHFPQLVASLDRKAIDKPLNADVSITLDSCSIKFHARPLYEVCRYEIDSCESVAVPAGYFDE